MSENYKSFDTIEDNQLGEIDVAGWRILGNHVRVDISGNAYDFGFDIKAATARALAAQLIAAADYAEGVS